MASENGKAERRVRCRKGEQGSGGKMKEKGLRRSIESRGKDERREEKDGMGPIQGFCHSALL
jgi:hypothetical protein